MPITAEERAKKNAKAREYYQDNKEKKIAYMRQHYQDNKEEIRAFIEKCHLKGFYEIDVSFKVVENNNVTEGVNLIITPNKSKSN